MGSFGGHALPGSFFLLYGLWLTVKHTFQHHWRRNQPKGIHKLPPIFNRMEYFEGGFKIFAAFVGIMVEQFVKGPHGRLYDRTTSSWVELMNWQHTTMYLFFGIYGIVCILSTKYKSVPAGFDRLALSLALFIEGFLFYFHVNHRPHLDAHIHSLLLVAVFGGSAFTLLEAFMRDNIVLELIKSSLFILQGSWFYQIGFVLYPLSGPQWDQDEMGNAMFVAMCFCWHVAMATLLTGVTAFSVWLSVKRCSGRGRDIEIGMRSNSSSQKALLEETDEE